MTITRLGEAGFDGSLFNEHAAAATLTNGNTLLIAGGLGGPGERALIADPSGESLLNVSLNSSPNFSIRDAAALADGGFVVLYAGNGTAADGSTNFGGGFRIFNADGTPRSDGTYVFEGSYYFGLLQVQGGIIALKDGGFSIVWNTTKDLINLDPFLTLSNGETAPISANTGVDLRMQSFDAEGRPVGAELLLTQGTINFPGYSYDRRAGNQFLADLDLQSNGDLAITYGGNRYTPKDTWYYTNLLAIDPLTQQVIFGETPYYDGPIASTSNNGALGGPAISAVLSNGQIAGIYELNDDTTGAGTIYLQLMNAAGERVNRPVDLKIRTGSVFDNLRSWGMVALADDSFVLAFTALKPGVDPATGTSLDFEIFLRHYGTNGALISQTRVTNDDVAPVIRDFQPGPDGSLLLTYYQTGNFTNRLVQETFAVTAAGDQVRSGGSRPDRIALGSGNDWADGEGGNDSIFGAAGRDRLYGGSGDDSLDGGAGGDTLRGGSGNDTYVVDHGSDVIFEAAAAGVDEVQSAVRSLDLSRFEEVENGRLTGSAALRLTGSDGDNLLIGNDGANLLIGGRGNDTLTGGAGNDTFRCIATASTAGKIDRITDFSIGSDLLDLKGIDANTTRRGNQAFVFRGEAPFSRAGQLRYEASQGVLSAELNGDRIPDFSISFSGNPALTASSILL